MVAFGFVWERHCFLVNDRINKMIPPCVSPCTSLLSAPVCFVVPISHHASDSASDPCRCSSVCAWVRVLSNCYHILSSADCYFGQLLGTHINTRRRLLNVKGAFGRFLILTPFSPRCQNVICCRITAILKSYFLRQWKC